MTRCKACASPGDIAGYDAAPSPGSLRFIVPAMSPAKGNTRASSLSAISYAPLAVRLAESLPALIARNSVGLDLPAVLAACASDNMESPS
jgi:hypothetical protein